MRNIIAYAIAFSSVALTSVVSQQFTNKSVKSPWYLCVQPSITPPPIVFPIVWTLLYVMIAIALSRALQLGERVTIILFSLNLLLNMTWCFMFFYHQLPSMAIYHIALLMVTIVAIMVATHDTYIRLLMIPYLLWILFATSLNYLAMQKEKKCLTGSTT